MIYYSCLKETEPIRDVSDLSGGVLAAVPATLRVHAVHVADNQIACPYTGKAEDIAEPDRDWFTVQPGEVPCEACLDAIQPPLGAGRPSKDLETRQRPAILTG